MPRYAPNSLHGDRRICHFLPWCPARYKRQRCGNWLHGTSTTETELGKRISEAGFHVEIKRGDIEDPILGVVTVQDRFGNMLDLILGIRGMDPAAAERAVETSLLDARVRIAGMEDLIAMKLFAGGVQDLEDVRGILQVASDSLNLALVRSLADRYGVTTQCKFEVLFAELPDQH